VPLKDFQFGYIDKSGKTIIEPQFCLARPFNEGIAVVKFTQVDWGLIDRGGRVVLRTSISTK